MSCCAICIPSPAQVAPGHHIAHQVIPLWCDWTATRGCPAMTLERPDNLVLVASLPEKPDSTVRDGCQLERDQYLYCAEFHHFVTSVLTPITSTTLADVV